VQRYGGKIFSEIPHLWYFFDVAKIAAKNKRFLIVVGNIRVFRARILKKPYLLRQP
jgi:hypothetical protein